MHHGPFSCLNIISFYCIGPSFLLFLFSFSCFNLSSSCWPKEKYTICPSFVFFSLLCSVSVLACSVDRGENTLWVLPSFWYSFLFYCLPSQVFFILFSFLRLPGTMWVLSSSDSPFSFSLFRNVFILFPLRCIVLFVFSLSSLLRHARPLRQTVPLAASVAGRTCVQNSPSAVCLRWRRIRSLTQRNQNKDGAFASKEKICFLGSVLILARSFITKYFLLVQFV